MAQLGCRWVAATDRVRRAALLADRDRSQKHVARARIILASAERLDVAEVARRAGIGRPAVWPWQLRFAEAGVDGLVRDRTREPGRPATAAALVQPVVALTRTAPPGEATHATGRAMARATGPSLRRVQRIWDAQALQPHRVRTFKRRRDAEFPARLEDIVDNYGSHKHPKLRAWLQRHPRWAFHYTPSSGSWLNAIETFFAALTRRRLRRGAFHAPVDLQAAINRYLADHNAHPKPFAWTATPASILTEPDHLKASVP